jgi:hypothetical protein
MKKLRAYLEGKIIKQYDVCEICHKPKQALCFRSCGETGNVIVVCPSCLVELFDDE